MISSQEEILDLVNEKDEIIGQKGRTEVYKEGLRNYRVINCFIKNKEGKLWIPRRQPTKKLFPSGLDVGCGGHVSSGETYDEAFAKEMAEELNIDVATVTYRKLGFCSPHIDGSSSFMQVYEVNLDNVPNYNPEDFSGYEWLYPAEVLAKLESGDTAKDELPRLIRKYYLNK